MRSLLLALSILISFDAFAQLTAEMTASSTTVPTGGTVTFTATIRNGRSTTFPSFSPTVQVASGRIVSFSGPNCVQTRANGVMCTTGPMAPGQTVTIEFVAMATNDAEQIGKQLNANVLIITVIPDHQLIQLSAHANVMITPSPSQIDLDVSVGPPPSGPQPLESIERVVTVSNRGPEAAVPVTVTVDLSEPLRFVEGSAPWVCTTGQGQSFTCTIARLGANDRADLRLRFQAPLARRYTLIVQAWAPSATDSAISNNIVITEISAGTAADFARVLVPLLVDETPGARATWTSHLTAMTVEGQGTIYFCTSSCSPGNERRVAMRPRWSERLWPSGTTGVRHGAMLYTERDAEPRLVFSSRLSSSRTTPARGVELPIVRESEFRTDRLVIPNLLLHASHRFMLRVYDPDAVPGTAVTVRLFSHILDRLLAERTVVLNTRPERVTVASLPAYPGYAEISDLFDRFIPANESLEVGVEIVGLRPGQKIWAFGSATENEGEHVTLIKPQ